MSLRWQLGECEMNQLKLLVGLAVRGYAEGNWRGSLPSGPLFVVQLDPEPHRYNYLIDARIIQITNRTRTTSPVHPQPLLNRLLQEWKIPFLVYGMYSGEQYFFYPSGIEHDLFEAARRIHLDHLSWHANQGWSFRLVGYSSEIYPTRPVRKEVEDLIRPHVGRYPVEAVVPGPYNPGEAKCFAG